MRSVKSIRRLLRSRVFRELKKSYRRYLTRRPVNCKYNKRVPVGDGTAEVGICLLFSKFDEVKVDKGLWICDQLEDAQNCEKFTCKYNKTQIKAAFEKGVLENPQKLEEEYKDIAALRWVLGNEKPEVPLYKRIWYKVTGRDWEKVFHDSKPALPSPKASNEE